MSVARLSTLPSVPLLLLGALSTGAACHKDDPPAAAVDTGGSDDAGEDTYVPKPTPVPVVPTLIGTGGFAYRFGSAFAGATAPNGLCKVGPDTKGPWGTVNFLHYTGYWYGDDTIQGFSHLHLSGTGATDYGVVTLMPTDTAVTAAMTKPAGYESKFGKPSETGSPGYYAVTLDRGSIRAELTATTHAAHHRYTWPAGSKAGHVLLDLDHHLSGGTVKDAELTASPSEQTVRGRLRHVGGMSGGFGGYDVFFTLRTKAPWTKAQTWSGGAAPAEGTSAKGTGVGLALDFDLGTDAAVEVALAVSLVSQKGADDALVKELPTFAFEATRAQTATAWQGLLDRVKVTATDKAQADMITAAVYHAFLMPSTTEDVDRTYVFGGKTQKSDDFTFVNDLSLWDTYRNLNPLYTLIAPERARDVVRSLHEMAKILGYFPKWPLATGEAGTMVGAGAEVVLADAYIKGIRDWDAAGAYAILRAAAMDATPPAGGRGGRDRVEEWMKYGYLLSTRDGSVSRSIEMAQDDVALGALAAALGKTDDATALAARSKGWRKLFDKETGNLWPKDASGAFVGDRSDETGFGKAFVEANAVQTTFGAFWDEGAYVELFGSRAKAVQKLEALFVNGKAEWDALDITDPIRSAGMRPYYWAGNEPDVHVGYLFSLLGRPDLAQKWLRWAAEAFYGPGADGLPGNDDGGSMSAWYLFTAFGFYPIAGTDLYVIGVPLVPRAEITVSGGTFVVEAPGVSKDAAYIQSVTLNGAPLGKPSFRHADLRAGGRLVFTMGPNPSGWARVD